MSHIMLVDDSPTQAAVIDMALVSAGHTVRHIADPSDVIAACRDSAPDLLIVDLYLGDGACGFELCRQVKANLSLQMLPLLVLTSSTDPEDQLKAMESGADRFLTKDADAAKVLATVDTLVRTSLPIRTLETDSRNDHEFVRGSRLLVVDDSPSWRKLVMPAFQAAGFQTETAESGEEALRMLAQKSFDICAIDVVMGQMDGLELCRQARKLAEIKQSLLGLLVVTGKESNDVWVQALDAGADDFVSKDTDIDIILAHARAVARRVRMLRLVQTTAEKAQLQELARQNTVRDLQKSREKIHQNEELAKSHAELRRTVSELQETRKRLEMANRELREFAFIASHDLQEPLRKIGSYSNLLQRQYADQLDEQGQRWLRYSIDGAARLQTLIQSLLAYTRVETRAQPLTEIDTALACQQAIADLGSEIKAAAADVTFDGLPRLAADKNQFVQLLRELIRNGIVFNQSDASRVEVSASRDGDAWRFSVRDNGIGVDAAYFEQIFEVFKRLHPSDEYSGAGIGLSLCRKIVHRHNGRIWPESTLGQGTTIHFTIPMVFEDAGQ